MTRYTVGPLSTYPAGERLGRIICTSGGRVIAWIMQNDGEITLSRPPTTALRRSGLRMRVTPLEASRPEFVAVECSACGIHEISERLVLDQLSNGQTNVTIRL